VLAAVFVLAGAFPQTAAAEITFQGNWETGDLAPWGSLQFEFDRPRGESFNVVSSPVREGRYSAQFAIRHGYSPFGWNESVEASWGASQGIGTEYYYGFSTLFPKGWVHPIGWGLFLQFYTARFPIFTGPSPIAFDAVGAQIRAHINTGLSPVSDGPTFQWEYNRTHVISPTLNLGKWNDFIVRVVWKSDWTGQFEVWHRVEGQSGYTKVVSLKNIPTLRQNPAYGTDAIGSIKQGLYRKSFCTVPVLLGCSSPLGIQGSSVLYHDGTVRAQTFQEAAAALGHGGTAAQPMALPAIPLVTDFLPVTDAACASCLVTMRKAGVQAAIAGGGDPLDTAYGLKDFGGEDGWAGATWARTLLGLAPDQVLTGDLTVFEMRDVTDQLVYQLNVSSEDGTLHLASPAGGLAGQAIDASTGVVVPNDGRRLLVEVSALKNDSVVILIDGVRTISLNGFSGATTGDMRYLRAGIERYAAAATDEPVRAYQVAVGVSAKGRLGNPFRASFTRRPRVRGYERLRVWMRAAPRSGIRAVVRGPGGRILGVRRAVTRANGRVRFTVTMRRWNGQRFLRVRARVRAYGHPALVTRRSRVLKLSHREYLHLRYG
jgi:hypothetical protein